jgi:hypothetical protein
VEEEKKKDLDRKRGKVAGSKTTSSAAEPKPGPAIKDGKPVFGTKDGLGAGAPLSLFDTAPQTDAGVDQEAAVAVTTTSAADAEEHGPE